MKKSKNQIISEEAPKSPIRKITIKFLIVGLICLMVIMFLDFKGYFNADDRNNHTLKKWNTFYEFTENNDVDIILLGNSHLYTGINPKNLSTALGVNAFILASPGTNISDSYYSLKEALTKCNPKIVVVETFCINEAENCKLSNGGLTDAFKSFSARKNRLIKLESTPFLFSVYNYIYAWSVSIRNHEYIFTNQKQIKANLETKKKEKKELYLGRFVTATVGLQDSIIKKYETDGSPADGSKYMYSKQAAHYTQKIVELCNSKNIDVIFLTLPMYERHIRDYTSWKNTLNEIIEPLNSEWLDMQKDYNNYSFDILSFENTYNLNQHMTYLGSLIATYGLASYLKTNFNSVLPNRFEDKTWITNFYGQEGYFENRPMMSDFNNYIKIKIDPSFPNSFIKECILQKQKNKTNKIFLKIDNDNLTNLNLHNTFIRTYLTFKDNNETKVAMVDFLYDKYHKPFEHSIFLQNIKNIEVTEILAAEIHTK